MKSSLKFRSLINQSIEIDGLVQYRQSVIEVASFGIEVQSSTAPHPRLYTVGVCRRRRVVLQKTPAFRQQSHSCCLDIDTSFRAHLS